MVLHFAQRKTLKREDSQSWWRSQKEKFCIRNSLSIKKIYHNAMIKDKIIWFYVTAKKNGFKQG